MTRLTVPTDLTRALDLATDLAQSYPVAAMFLAVLVSSAIATRLVRFI